MVSYRPNGNSFMGWATVFGKAREAWNSLLIPRVLIASCQAATIIILWRTFAAREHPPPLPILDLPIPQIGMGVPLIASLVIVCFYPRVGLAIHWLLLTYAIAADQTRIVLPILSLALLLVGTTSWHLGRVIATSHLIALWFWAGFNKLLSPGYYEATALPIHNQLPFGADRLSYEQLGWLIGGYEMAVAIVILIRPLRKIGIFLAIALHTGILLTVSPLIFGWRFAIWPWNIAAAISTIAFFRDLPGFIPKSRSNWRTRLVTATLILSPAGFYLGVLNPYFSYNIFTNNLPKAFVCNYNECWNPDIAVVQGLKQIGLLPERRIYEMYFKKTCRPKETLIVLPRETRIPLIGRNTEIVRQTCLEVRGS